ncbi:YciE/YciF ferroxidase family protein [Halalkalicoccus ordinarius]|uniref:YciE/YciF ferroxidase family protein n=1 Tax=Halalkalicoccus ordinarius TaxID=3116651 RepID=UPI00300F67BE
MSVDSTEDLLVEGLQHVYYTEQRLLDALEELESTSTQEELQQGFSEHREETQKHVERLEQVFEQLGQEPEAAEDPVVEGMIEAHEEFVNKDPSDAALNRFNIAAGQKSEHYEIAAYGNLTPLADQAGYDEAADLLEQNMREEQDALDELSELGENFDYGELEA